MTRRITQAQRNRELQRLVDEQSDDMSSTILFPELIRPLNAKMLIGLTIKEKSSIILSVIGKMSNREIGSAMKCPESTVRGYIKRGYVKLRGKYDK